MVRKFFIGFKGKNNSSCMLVERLTKDGCFLTNSFQGVKQDIEKLEQKADVVYMFGIDNQLVDEVRIEQSARRENDILYSTLDLKQISQQLESVGIKNHIVDKPTNYLCNEAYWHALKKFRGKVVFIHIPSIRNFDEDFAKKIERAIV